MKYEVRFTTQFKKDLKLAKKQGKSYAIYQYESISSGAETEDGSKVERTLKEASQQLLTVPLHTMFLCAILSVGCEQRPL